MIHFNIQKTVLTSAVAIVAFVGVSTAETFSGVSKTPALKDNGAAATWKQGETLSYKVYFGMLRAGKATIQYKETGVHGHDSQVEPSNFAAPLHRYDITVRAKTSGLAKSLFKLDDTIAVSGYTDSSNTFPYQPYRYNLTLSEGKYRANKEITFGFDRKTNAGTATFRNILKPELKPEVFDVQAETRDILSAMYFLRSSVDASSIKVGDTYTLPIYGTKSQYTMDVVVTEEREMKTSYKQKTLKMWHIEPLKKSDSENFNAEQSKPWGVWVTQDANLTPINIDVHLKSGTFKARLNKIWPL